MSDIIRCDYCQREDSTFGFGYQRTSFLDNEFVVGPFSRTFCSWSCMALYAAWRHHNPQGGLAEQDQAVADYRRARLPAPPEPRSTP